MIIGKLGVYLNVSLIFLIFQYISSGQGFLHGNSFSRTSRPSFSSQRIFKQGERKTFNFNTARQKGPSHRPKFDHSPLFANGGAKADDNPYFRNMDAYQILEIPKGSDIPAVKSAYKKLVVKWHPDRFPNDEAKKKEGSQRMEKINRAYYCLNDKDRKERYDKFGEAGVGTSESQEEMLKRNNGPIPEYGGGFEDQGGGFEDFDQNDIFSSFFDLGGLGGKGFSFQQRGSKRTNEPEQGDDIRVQLDIPFMTSIYGKQETIKVRRKEECSTCKGNGCKPGTSPIKCSTCGGTGNIQQRQRTPFGIVQTSGPCNACKGKGFDIREKCNTCGGFGQITENKDITITIPSGVETDTTLRVIGGGNVGKRGGSRGNLFVQLRVLPDPKFTRDGNDILSNEYISYLDAILGSTIKAQTVDGNVDVKITPGIQPDTKIRIKGKGTNKVGSKTKGDAIVTIKVKVPSNVTGKEKELLQQLADLERNKNNNK